MDTSLAVETTASFEAHVRDVLDQLDTNRTAFRGSRELAIVVPGRSWFEISQSGGS